MTGFRHSPTIDRRWPSPIIDPRSSILDLRSRILDPHPGSSNFKISVPNLEAYETLTQNQKNAPIASHRAALDVSNTSFGSSFNFRTSILDQEAYGTLT